MNERDMTRLAERCRDLARHIEERGTTALRVAAQWTNPRHPDSIGGGDPDSEPGDRDKRDRLDPMRHARLVAGFGRIDAAVATLAWLILDTVPQTPKPSTDCPDGACRNCWLDRRHYEPTAHYKDLCRWCGDFRSTEGRVPPLVLLRKRHAGQRVTTSDVEKALGRSA